MASEFDGVDHDDHSSSVSHVRRSFELQLGKHHVSTASTDASGKTYKIEDEPTTMPQKQTLRLFPTFAKDSVMLIELLKRPHGMRKQWELESLANLCQGVDLFRALEFSVQLQLCNFLSYEFCRAGETVFTQGDVGSKFYIIIDGQVAVRVNNAYGNAEDWRAAKLRRQKSVSKKGATKSGASKEEPQEGDRVATLQSGDTFGELALVGKGGELRQATVKAELDCHLLVIEKENYDRMLSDLHRNEMDEKSEFLRKVPIFVDIPESELLKLAHVAQNRRYQSKSVIFRQGAESDAVYFIRKGHVRLINEVSLDDREYHHVCKSLQAGRRDTSVRPLATPGGEPPQNPVVYTNRYKRDLLPLPESSTMEQQRLSRSKPQISARTRMHPFFNREDRAGRAAGKAQKKIMIQVDTLGPRMMFGEVGVAEQSKRRLTAVASTNLEVLVLSRIDFYSKLKPETIRSFRKVARSVKGGDQQMSAVKSGFFETMRWEAYKVGLLESLALGRKRVL